MKNYKNYKNFNGCIKTILTILFLFIYCSTFSQTSTSKIDSLNLELARYPKEDTVRVNLLNEISFENYSVNIDETKKYADEANILAHKIGFLKGEAKSFYLKTMYSTTKYDFEEASKTIYKSLNLYNKLGDLRGMSECYNSIGTINYYQGSYDTSIEYFDKAANIARNLGIKKEQASYINNIGNINLVKGNFKGAIKYYKEAISIYESIGEKVASLNPLSNIAIIYTRQGRNLEALKCFQQCLEIDKEQKNKTSIYSDLINIGAVYAGMEDNERALNYYEKALKISKELDNEFNISASLISIANVYRVEKKYMSSLEYLDKAFDICKKIDSKKGMLTVYHNIATVHLKKGDLALALKNYQIALALAELLGEKRIIGTLNVALARVHIKLKEYSKAKKYIKKGKKIVDNLSLLEHQKEANLINSELNEQEGNYKKALEDYVIYKQLSDSIFNKENIRKIAEVEYEYKFKQELESANFRESKLTEKVTETSNELQQTKQSFLIGVIISLLIVMLLGMRIFLLKIKNVKSINENILMEQKLLRSQMTPHFIFNSLSVLQGIILNKEEIKAVKYLSKFSKLLRITLENSRDKMVLLEKELEAVENYISIQNLGAEIPFSYTIKKSEKINGQEILIPPMLIQPFVENAIEHAFMEQQSNKKIEINIQFVKEQLTCSVLDNGMGIDANKKNNNENSNKNKKSLATKITSERLKMLAKEFKIEASITIKDRNYNNKKGTEVIVILPYKKVQND